MIIEGVKTKKLSNAMVHQSALKTNGIGIEPLKELDDSTVETKNKNGPIKFYQLAEKLEFKGGRLDQECKVLKKHFDGVVGTGSVDKDTKDDYTNSYGRGGDLSSYANPMMPKLRGLTMRHLKTIKGPTRRHSSSQQQFNYAKTITNRAFSMEVDPAKTPDESGRLMTDA